MSYREEMMQRAIALAQLGAGFVNPNPLVGCVLVKDGRVIAEGYHQRFGGPHAERNAILHCHSQGLSPRGAEAYVTLEPCCHHGKQPPCSQLLIDEGIAKVYVGIADPNPLVAGRGIAQLRQAGIEVEVGFLQDCIAEQNKVFLTSMTLHRPYVLMKTATTLDGKIATATGDSRWVTGPEARRHVHRLRHQLMAVMVGIGTVLADDPQLTCRLDGCAPLCQPYRIVVDTRARIPLQSQLVLSARQWPLIVVHGPEADADKVAALAAAGAETLCCNTRDIGAMLGALARPAEGRPAIDSILLEGGAALNASFLKAGMVDEINLFVAPKIAGAEALAPVGPLGIERMADALAFSLAGVRQMGQDVLLEYKADTIKKRMFAGIADFENK